MPHTLRHMLGTHLANDPNVSIKESLATMRHNSVAANLNYQKNNRESEENRLIALGYVPPDENEEMPSDVIVKTSDSDSKYADLKTSPTQSTAYASQPTTESAIVRHDSFYQSPSVNLSETLAISEGLAYYTQPDDDDGSASSFVENLKHAPSTQCVINMVKEDLHSIEFEHKKSEERRQIISLGREVQFLKRKLNEQAKTIYLLECEKLGINPSCVESSKYNENPPTKKQKRPRPRNPYAKMREGN